MHVKQPLNCGNLCTTNCFSIPKVSAIERFHCTQTGIHKVSIIERFHCIQTAIQFPKVSIIERFHCIVCIVYKSLRDFRSLCLFVSVQYIGRP